MIYVILSKLEKNPHGLIVNFIKQNIKFNDFEYKLLFIEHQHIIENSINLIDKTKDIVLWQPIIAYDNLEVVKSFANSIVILEKPSLYLQKISRFNPINENLAINNGFFIIYINPDTSDITNDEWKLVVQEDMYLMTIEKLLTLIKQDETNIRTEKIKQEDIFESITNNIKNQVNFN